ncbi:ribosome recycling factor, partial [Staphylococcus aureus]|uniref:ribosome recycling factor n=1 Tax=Staphylococcus aureus TaxID=1280 RepID=UPI0010231325
RKEVVKDVKKIGEDAQVAVRNVLRDSNDELKKQQKNSDITEDDLRTQTDDLQKLTDDSIKAVEKLLEEKEHDIM